MPPMAEWSRPAPAASAKSWPTNGAPLSIPRAGRRPKGPRFPNNMCIPGRASPPALKNQGPPFPFGILVWPERQYSVYVGRPKATGRHTTYSTCPTGKVYPRPQLQTTAGPWQKWLFRFRVRPSWKLAYILQAGLGARALPILRYVANYSSREIIPGHRTFPWSPRGPTAFANITGNRQWRRHCDHLRDIPPPTVSGKLATRAPIPTN